MFYSSTGRDLYPLVLTLIAIFTAAGGSDVDTADFEEPESIAIEINFACYEWMCPIGRAKSLVTFAGFIKVNYANKVRTKIGEMEALMIGVCFFLLQAW